MLKREQFSQGDRQSWDGGGAGGGAGADGGVIFQAEKPRDFFLKANKTWLFYITNFKEESGDKIEEGNRTEF